MENSIGNAQKEHYRAVVVLTGAGVSAESGVPVFRGDDGLWEGRRAEEVATAYALARDPWGVNEFFNGLRAKVPSVLPNPAHLALAEFEREFSGTFLLVTQNIDDLHDRAGSRNLIHLHGELLRVACTACGESSPFDSAVYETTRCPACDRPGFLRPDITLFNEMPKRLDEIAEALAHCDLFIAIGTSGVVYPAAGFVDLARRAGADTIEVNLAETERSPAFRRHIVGPAGQTVPALMKQILALG